MKVLNFVVWSCVTLAAVLLFSVVPYTIIENGKVRDKCTQAGGIAVRGHTEDIICISSMAVIVP